MSASSTFIRSGTSCLPRRSPISMHVLHPFFLLYFLISQFDEKDEAAFFNIHSLGDLMLTPPLSFLPTFLLLFSSLGFIHLPLSSVCASAIKLKYIGASQLRSCVGV